MYHLIRRLIHDKLSKAHRCACRHQWGDGFSAAGSEIRASGSGQDLRFCTCKDPGIRYTLSPKGVWNGDIRHDHQCKCLLMRAEDDAVVDREWEQRHSDATESDAISPGATDKYPQRCRQDVERDTRRDCRTPRRPDSFPLDRWVVQTDPAENAQTMRISSQAQTLVEWEDSRSVPMQPESARWKFSMTWNRTIEVEV